MQYNIKRVILRYLNSQDNFMVRYKTVSSSIARYYYNNDFAGGITNLPKSRNTDLR